MRKFQVFLMISVVVCSHAANAGGRFHKLIIHADFYSQFFRRHIGVFQQNVGEDVRAQAPANVLTR